MVGVTLGMNLSLLWLFSHPFVLNFLPLSFTWVFPLHGGRLHLLVSVSRRLLKIAYLSYQEEVPGTVGVCLLRELKKTHEDLLNTLGFCSGNFQGWL